jgi:peptide/nickel transport system substrate-binding protein
VKYLLASLLAAMAMAGPAAGEPVAALAMHGAPQHAAGFLHFPYVNPDAPKGGRITLGTLGTFDSLNPFIIKGVAPPGVREYVYESLMTRGADEPFTLYGLIADTVEVPEDRSSITFHLRPEARFSDGMPVTPQDVLFSHQILKSLGQPYQRTYYSKVTKAEQVGPRSVRFTLAASDDREMPLILGLMPVLPRHKFTPQSFALTSLEPPVGSGPYRVVQVNPGRSITYRRNPDWWARELAVARGRFNFEEIRVEHFRDSSSLFEAFKAGEIHVRVEDDPGRWIGGYPMAAITAGRLFKEELTTGLPSGMAAFVFNMRRPMFEDARVRRAFILLFDAEWINRSLFNGLYERTQSFFERSVLSSHGRPVDARERTLLAPYMDAVRPDILDGTFRFPTSDAATSDRANLQAAHELLTQAGYELKRGRLVKNGTPLAFEFLAQTRQQERLMLSYAHTLERLGIGVRIRQVDSAQYWSRLQSFDFDMIQWTWSASLSPGNEQFNRWSSGAALTPGSLNYAGVKNLAADAMIETFLKARSNEDFESSVRAFDRVLLSGDYVVPLYHLPKVWVAYWKPLRHPAILPLSGFDLDCWWFAPP